MFRFPTGGNKDLFMFLRSFKWWREANDLTSSAMFSKCFQSSNFPKELAIRCLEIKANSGYLHAPTHRPPAILEHPHIDNPEGEKIEVLGPNGQQEGLWQDW